MRYCLKILSLFVFLMISGCQSELFSNLTEEEANEILVALLAVSVDVEKTNSGEGKFLISVNNDEILKALDVLKDQGLPKKNRDSMGKVFAKSGIVSSPFEERVRYIYALGEDVAQTLQQIDGVLTARVHIVLAEEPELGQKAKESSAAVFIKQRANIDLDFLIPQIRRLVSNSIEGVKYDAVTVILVEARRQIMPITKAKADLREVVPGLRVVEASVSTFWKLVAMAIALILLLLVGNIVQFFMQNRRTESPVVMSEAESDL